MANPLPAVNDLALTPLEREQRTAASRYVLRAARDREDLHLLLDALGLNTSSTPKES